MQRQGKQRSTSGPALPSKLDKEIAAGNSEAGPRNERVSKAFAVADRKAQRKAKRQQKGQQRLRFTQKLPQKSSSARPPVKALSKKRSIETRYEVWSGGSSRQLSRIRPRCLLQVVNPSSKRAKTNERSPADSKPHVTSTINKSTAKRLRKPGRKESKFDELVQGSSLQVCPTCCVYTKACCLLSSA